jgi:thioredoxin-related protein
MFALAFAGVIASLTADEPRIKWVRRIDDAQRIAAATEKDLFINFTGSEWCFHCIQLDREVLSQKEFAAAANEFVLVELDFPNDRDQLGEMKSIYLKWVEQYLIQGYPTVVLADQSGRPYAYFVGHKQGTAPAAYLDQLRKARESRATRDRELAAAKDATGSICAQKLHAALTAVADNLGSIEDHDDDPVLVLYAPEVEEIQRLDAENRLGLKAIYDARIAARDDYRRSQAVFKELEKFGKDEWRAAIAYLDKQLP